MAISNTNSSLLAFTTVFLMLLISKAYSSDSTSFSFTSFRPDEKNLILQGDALISPSKTLELTKTDGYNNPVTKTVGRVLHSTQVRLYEKGTNKVASIVTKFRFSLYSPEVHKGDGIAFFIAPPETTIPAGWAGATLGLFDLETALNASANQVVAVEFDTYFIRANPWDPSYNHMGIDVNSIDSLTTTGWERKDHESVDFVITYYPNTRILEVGATYPNGQKYELSHVVDLKAVLPEWVRVGFSAASGGATQTHVLHSWSFTSTLVDTGNKVNKHLASVV